MNGGIVVHEKRFPKIIGCSMERDVPEQKNLTSIKDDKR